MDHAKLLDVLTSLPISHAILPRAVCFATSRPASHVICSYIDSSGYASGPIRRYLFLDYIIIIVILVVGSTLSNINLISAMFNLFYFYTMLKSIPFQTYLYLKKTFTTLQ